jgi:arsenate reductase-like glutaredoxin family protein
MLRFPTLVKRPVLESRDFILLGFTPDHYRQILRLSRQGQGESP